MSFLSGLRGLVGGGGLREIAPEWNQPETEAEADSILKNSERLQLIYKHSFACGVCAFSKSAVESQIDKFSEIADLHFVDVRASRAVSNYIADKTGVKHESPQVLVLNKGKVLWQASHGGIDSGKILKALGGG